MATHRLYTKKKTLIAKLAKGKDMAIQLRTLLEKQPAVDPVASASPGELLHQILNTFSTSIAELSSSTARPAPQIPAGTVDSTVKTKKSPPATVKSKRGCYKRRRSSESWTVESSTTEDGFAWRKYGQKVILNSNFPRCYYRCTHKYESGCKATKQVQKIKVGKPTFFQTTYINRHTCKADVDSHLIKFYPSKSVESNNLMSFHAKQDDGVDNKVSKIPTTVDSAVKLEPQSSTTTDDVQSEEVVSDAKSTTLVQEDVPKAELEYEPEWGSGHESTSLPYEMEIDHFSNNDEDILSFFCFDDGNM